MILIVTEESGLSYELNNRDFTAKIVSSPNACDDIFIPRSIFHQTYEYIITEINEVSFKHNNKINTIVFSDDSELLIIYKEAFSNCTFKSITIPKHVKIIGEGSFYECQNLKTVNFSPDSQLISIEKDTFLYSAIEEITIPKSVTIIKEGAFKECYNLKKVDFQSNSELVSIEKDAFCNSSLESISIPSNVKELKEGWSHCISQLVHITISSENKNFTYFNKKIIIGKNKKENENDDYDVLYFARRDIESIIIPSSIKYINPFSFSDCCNLQKVKFLNDSKLFEIGYEAFCFSSIKKFCIPSSVRQIGDLAFNGCKNLKKIEFNKKSELISIGKFAFSDSSIEKVSIPSHTLRIEEKAFFQCCDLKKVEFSEDSKLTSIGEYVFSNSAIENISIPKNVNQIGERCFSRCQDLKAVNFHEESKLESISNFTFCDSSIQSLSISENLKYFDEGWCHLTKNLTNISISSKNKNFKYIYEKMIVGKLDKKSDIFDVLVFARRDVDKIEIPFFIKKIESYSFSGCTKLKEIEFSKDSELSTIGKCAFYFNSFKNIRVPFQTKILGELAFSSCTCLKAVEVLSENVEIKNFCFFNCKSLMLIAFPNSQRLSFTAEAYSMIPDDTAIFLLPGAMFFIS